MAKDYSKEMGASLDTMLPPKEDAQEPEKAAEEISRSIAEDDTAAPMLNPSGGETDAEEKPQSEEVQSGNLYRFSGLKRKTPEELAAEVLHDESNIGNRIIRIQQDSFLRDSDEVKQQTVILSQTAPRGYRLVYPDGADHGELIETKSKKFQMLFAPKLHKAVKARAKKEKISINEYLHRVLSRYADLDETQQNDLISALSVFNQTVYEKKTKRCELLIQPSVYGKIQRIALKCDKKIAACIHLLLDYDIHKDTENAEKE